ncbi:MAG: phosphate ABC transporter ATP-binding protein, partial [Terriglobales bacterium]
MSDAIQVRELRAFFGVHEALHGINMDIGPRAVTAIIGPSGCGKSTFVRCINRMHETVPGARVTGSIDVFGLKVYDGGTPAVEVRRRIGMVFQKPNPFPTMSIYDNVAAGLKLNGFRKRRELDEVVEKSLKQSALWDEVKDIMKKKSGSSLSGGQQQRLCIARALAVEPEVLLM